MLFRNVGDDSMCLRLQILMIREGPSNTGCNAPPALQVCIYIIYRATHSKFLAKWASVRWAKAQLSQSAKGNAAKAAKAAPKPSVVGGAVRKPRSAQAEQN